MYSMFQNEFHFDMILLLLEVLANREAHNIQSKLVKCCEAFPSSMDISTGCQGLQKLFGRKVIPYNNKQRVLHWF